MKSETNQKLEVLNLISNFDIQICLEFRISNLEF